MRVSFTWPPHSSRWTIASPPAVKAELLSTGCFQRMSARASEIQEKLGTFRCIQANDARLRRVVGIPAGLRHSRREDLIDCTLSRGEALLERPSQHRIELLAIRIHAIGPHVRAHHVISAAKIV